MIMIIDMIIIVIIIIMIIIDTIIYQCTSLCQATPHDDIN